jgi:mannose-6-phosphate isomerase-like protein (cupin superfamily)
MEEMMSTVVRALEGQALQVLSDTVTLKLRSADSQNAMAVMHIDLPAGSFVPPHSHGKEEEGYFVLSGELLMHLDGKEVPVAAGDFIHVPSGHLHGYRNPHAAPCRMLAWTVGGAMDQFFTDMHSEIRSMPDDLPKMPPILQKHGIHMPPPEQ